jgi:hypothetical protein
MAVRRPPTSTLRPIAVTSSRFHSAECVAAVRSMNCLRVAGAALSAIRAVAISRGVIRLLARHSTALGRDAGDAEAGLKHLQHGFDLHHAVLSRTPWWRGPRAASVSTARIRLSLSCAANFALSSRAVPGQLAAPTGFFW